jgi:UDP-N-acetylglucosamine/UDP-N-acetylgalactosamine diphosphorylase
LTNDGKIFLQDRSTVAVAPDGNGGLYAALRQPLADLPGNMSVLQHMQSRGIQHVHAYCVDNCLVRVADPVFLGYSIEKQAETGAKVVKKRHATESVGVLAKRNGKYGVVANIANHYFTLEFLQKMEALEQKMTFHIARKKIAHVDTTSGEAVKPSQPNGMKLELFVFDVFPFTERLAVLEVPRSEEFSPLKNAPGSASDCPETSRKDILAQHAGWLKNAGCEVEEGCEVEIDPKVSYAGEGLEAFKGKKVGKSVIIDSVDLADKL